MDFLKECLLDNDKKQGELVRNKVHFERKENFRRRDQCIVHFYKPDFVGNRNCYYTLLFHNVFADFQHSQHHNGKLNDDYIRNTLH